MYRVRPRDFDLTVRRHVDQDRDRTPKRRGEHLYRTIKYAIDVEKAFAVEEPPKPIVAADGPSASDDDWCDIEIEVDLSELYPDGCAPKR